VLVNDHDPKPLYYELRSMHGDVIDWEYASRGSGEWRVEIMKTDASIADNEGVITRYDVQEIPKSDRHETIHHRYGMIPDGEKVEIVAPHEPRPLRREFREQYGDTFDWEVVEKSPGAAGYRSRKPNKANPRPTVRPPRRRRLPMTGVRGSVRRGTREYGGARRPRPSTRAAPREDLRGVRSPRRRRGIYLVNDHDPKPLYHQFDAEAGPEFYWEYRKRDPGEFRVLIGKAEAHDGGDPTVSEDPNTPF